MPKRSRWSPTVDEATISLKGPAQGHGECNRDVTPTETIAVPVGDADNFLLADKPGVISPPRLTAHKASVQASTCSSQSCHSLNGGCWVRKMRQPESNVSRMIGQTISHYRIVEKFGGRYGCGLQPLKKMKADQAAFMEEAAGPH